LPVSLSPDPLISDALGLHEHGTIAFKHGALVASKGQIQVEWDVKAGSPTRMRLSWYETGRGLVKPPKHQGFGSRLVQRAMRGAGAKVSVSFPPTALSAR